MKITKSELKSLIKECLKEELNKKSSRKSLKEDTVDRDINSDDEILIIKPGDANAKFDFTEADFFLNKILDVKSLHSNEVKLDFKNYADRCLAQLGLGLISESDLMIEEVYIRREEYDRIANDEIDERGDEIFFGLKLKNGDYVLVEIDSETNWGFPDEKYFIEKCSSYDELIRGI